MRIAGDLIYSATQSVRACHRASDYEAAVWYEKCNEIIWLPSVMTDLLVSFVGVYSSVTPPPSSQPASAGLL